MTLTNILLFVTVALLGYLIFRSSAKKNSDSDRIHREMLENLRREMQEGREKDRMHLQERVDAVQKVLTENTLESGKAFHAHMKQGQDLIKNVTERLTKLDETNKQVLNFSEQLQDLQNTLQNPKSKGVLSEYWLETMLSHVLQPDQYKMQYKFSNGEIVDAVVFSQDKIIPIDAKFSSEGFNAIGKEKDVHRKEKLEDAFKKDLKQRIDETAKYIRPEENTTDYAFMFIPAEGIYYDLLVQKVGTMDVNRTNLIRYAHEKRVLIVSPNTFFAFLQTVIEGMRAYKMQESVQGILRNVEKLGKHLKSHESFMQKVGTHLGTTVSMYNQAYSEFRKVDKDVFTLTDGKEGGEVDPLLLEKPVEQVS